MKKVLLTIIMVCISNAVALAGSHSDYISPNFDPKQIHSIFIMGVVPPQSSQYVVDPNLCTNLPVEMKKELNLKDINIDTLVDVMLKIQNETGKNVFAMSQSNNQALIDEAYKMFETYVKKHYDTGIFINILQGNYGEVYSNGIDINIPTAQTATITDNRGRMGNITVRGMQQQTIGRGIHRTANVTLLMQVMNMYEGEVVFSRQEYRDKISSGVGATTPEDIGRRIVASFAHDFSKKVTKR